MKSTTEYVRLDSLRGKGEVLELMPNAIAEQGEKIKCERCGREFFGATARQNKNSHFFCLTKKEQAYNIRLAKLRFLKKNSPDKLSLCSWLYLKCIDCCVSTRKIKSRSDLKDREEGHIAAIWPTNDRSKMGRSDGLQNLRRYPRAV